MQSTMNVWDTKEKIVLPSMKDILKKYPQFSAVSETLSLQKAIMLFIDIIRTFKSGELSSDELSVLGNRLFALAVAYPDSDMQTDLFDAALAAGELAFYIRFHVDSLPGFLMTVDGFYKKYKSLHPAGELAYDKR